MQQLPSNALYQTHQHIAYNWDQQIIKFPCYLHSMRLNIILYHCGGRQVSLTALSGIPCFNGAGLSYFYTSYLHGPNKSFLIHSEDISSLFDRISLYGTYILHIFLFFQFTTHSHFNTHFYDHNFKLMFISLLLCLVRSYNWSIFFTNVLPLHGIFNCLAQIKKVYCHYFVQSGLGLCTNNSNLGLFSANACFFKM